MLVINHRSMQILANVVHHQDIVMNAARQALYDIGKENVSYCRFIILRGKKTGRLYRIAGRKRRHRASAPWEAPANLTGRLRRGVKFNVDGSRTMYFGDTVFYGEYLETGTRYMHPRPHLSTTVKHTQDYAERRLLELPVRAINNENL